MYTEEDLVVGGGTTRVVQYSAIDHMLSYYVSRGIVLFFPNYTMHVIPPLPSSTMNTYSQWVYTKLIRKPCYCYFKQRAQGC